MEIVETTPQHVEELAFTMREADRLEVQASGGFSPYLAIRESVRASTFSHTLLVGGEVLAIWGVVPLGGTVLTPGEAGVVWALTSTAVERHKRLFARTSRTVLRGLLSVYPVLVNAVDARYEAALRWAKWLGFQVGEAKPFGFEGRPFHLIEIRKEG